MMCDELLMSSEDERDLLFLTGDVSPDHVWGVLQRAGEGVVRRLERLTTG